MFCGPKTGARFWTQKWGHNTKISSPASKCVVPILGPWCMRFAFCKERVELRQVASSIHVFLRLVPGCWFHSAGYAVKEGKKHAGPQPQKWVRVAAQAKGTFQKGQGCQCCSAANMTATSNAKTCVPPAAVYRTLGATPGTPRYQS